MTATKNLDLLAQQDWQSLMKDVFKEAIPQFGVLKKNILDYKKEVGKEVGKAKKVAEHDARKATTAVVRAVRAHGCA